MSLVSHHGFDIPHALVIDRMPYGAIFVLALLMVLVIGLLMLLAAQISRLFATRRPDLSAPAAVGPRAPVLQLLAPAAAVSAPLAYSALVHATASRAANSPNTPEPSFVRLRRHRNQQLSENARAV